MRELEVWLDKLYHKPAIDLTIREYERFTHLLVSIPPRQMHPRATEPAVTAPQIGGTRHYWKKTAHS